MNEFIIGNISAYLIELGVSLLKRNSGRKIRAILAHTAGHISS